MFEAIIFDWDGTLADTRQMVAASFQKTLSEVNCTISNEFIERHIGIGAAETFREILRTSRISFDEALIRRLVEKKIKTQIDLSQSVKLFEGATELLSSLHGKAKLALASMNNRDVINHILNRMDARRFFDAILTVDEVRNPKPDPEIFLKAALKLECQPEKCVIVEDSIFGVKAAKAARMSCIVVLTGVYSREELKKANPDLIVNSLSEKDTILRFLL